MDAADMSSSSLSSAVSANLSTLSQDEYYQKLKRPVDLRLQLSVPAADQPLMPAALKEVLAIPNPYLQLLIGPEGGLSVEECQQAEQVGFLPWQIGERVLRTETAPVVALSTLYALSQSALSQA
jgi:16S rRNA (uracil1498-N3)-methyltransferase